MPRKKKKATIEQLVNKIVKNSKELREKGFSKEEILYLVAFSVGGLALVTGLGLGGVALSRKMRERRREEAEKEREKERERRQRIGMIYRRQFNNPLENFQRYKDERETAKRQARKDREARAQRKIASFWKKRREPRESFLNSNIQPEREVVVFGKMKKRKKVSKKPSATLRRLCKKYKVRLTVKRGKKRVYKSEKVLKKQCKTAMKRKK